MLRALILLFLVLMSGPAMLKPAQAQEPIEIFDAHLHYNWEPKPYYSLSQVLQLFKEQRVTGILATSRPNDGTHALVDSKAPGLWGCHSSDPTACGRHPELDERPYDLRSRRERVQRGYYRGIGEFHLSAKQPRPSG